MMARQTVLAQGLFHIYSLVLAPKIVAKKPKLFPPNATLPPPRFIKVQDHGNSRNSWKFFDYWRSLAGTVNDPTEKAELVEVRFYMHWPVVSLKLVEPNRSDTVFKMFTGAMWFENPEDYVEECQKELGSGGWHVVLNEVNIHGALCEAYFSAIDLDRYPVKIDLRTLVKGDTKNSDYIRWLGVQGVRTPWDNPEDEENEMANDTLNVVANVLERQADAVINATKEVAEVRVQAAQDEVERIKEETSERGDKRSSAESESIKLVSDVAREANHSTLEMARDMVTMARENHNKESINPLELLRTAVELVKPQGDQGVTVFIQALKEQNSANQEFMRSMMGMKKAPDGTWLPSEAPKPEASSFEAEVTRFQRMADIFGYQKPGAVTQYQQNPQSPPREPEKGFWSAVAENPIPFLTAATTLITLGANLIYNLQAEPGKATSPQEALQKAQQAPPPTQHAQQQPADPKNLQSWVPFANHILSTGCFKAHFHGKDSGLSGFSFAEFILSNFTGGGVNEQGRRNYSSIQENLGLDGFNKLIRSVPALWDIVKDTPQQYEQFLNEFFSYDEMVSKQQEPVS